MVKVELVVPTGTGSETYHSIPLPAVPRVGEFVNFNYFSDKTIRGRVESVEYNASVMEKETTAFVLVLLSRR